MRKVFAKVDEVEKEVSEGKKDAEQIRREVKEFRAKESREVSSTLLAKKLRFGAENVGVGLTAVIVLNLAVLFWKRLSQKRRLALEKRMAEQRAQERVREEAEIKERQRIKIERRQQLSLKLQELERERIQERENRKAALIQEAERRRKARIAKKSRTVEPVTYMPLPVKPVKQRRPLMKLDKASRDISRHAMKLSSRFYLICSQHGLNKKQIPRFLQEVNAFPEEVQEKKVEDFRLALNYLKNSNADLSSEGIEAYLVRVIRQGFDKVPRIKFLASTTVIEKPKTVFTEMPDFLEWLSQNRRNALRTELENPETELENPESETYKRILFELEGIGKRCHGSLRKAFEDNKLDVLENLIELRMLLVEFGGARHGQHAPIDGIVNMVNPRPHLVKIIRKVVEYWISKGILITHAGKTNTFLADMTNPKNLIFRPDREKV